MYVVIVTLCAMKPIISIIKLTPFVGIRVLKKAYSFPLFPSEVLNILNIGGPIIIIMIWFGDRGTGRGSTKCHTNSIVRALS